MIHEFFEQTEVDKLSLLASRIFASHHESFARIKPHSTTSTADEFMLIAPLNDAYLTPIVIKIVNNGDDDEVSQVVIESHDISVLTPESIRKTLLENFSGPFARVYAELDAWIINRCQSQLRNREKLPFITKNNWDETTPHRLKVDSLPRPTK